MAHAPKPPSVDDVVPGVSDAFARLRDSDGKGIYTSLGSFYNHTIFGRDASMSAKFVVAFDHAVAWDTILTLASMQGVRTSDVTQEAPGRIHHEWRDFTTWRANVYNRIGMNIAARVWGKRNKKLLTYFASDTTADYIRLVHKYWRNSHQDVLDRQVPQQDGQITPLRESLYRAGAWLVRQVNDQGLFVTRRTNRWSLPYQTFADSVTAYTVRGGRALNTGYDHSFIEVQVYVLDAIQDTIEMLADDPRIAGWTEVAARMRTATFQYFWDETSTQFSAAIELSSDRPTRADGAMITAGWTLNASFWQELDEPDYRRYVEKIIGRLFQRDLMTAVGIRTKSTATKEPLGRDIDYHGSRTVWPMFNFMVIEGLLRHGFYRLAEQLENRVLNGINAIGSFPEFMIVDHDHTMYRADKRASYRRQGQMIPEQRIAFTVVPALMMAHRRLQNTTPALRSKWHAQLEQRMLRELEAVELLPPEVAPQALPTVPVRIDRTLSGIRSALHIAPVVLGSVKKTSSSRRS